MILIISLFCAVSHIRSDMGTENKSDCSLRSRRRALILCMGPADLPVNGMFADCYSEIGEVCGSVVDDGSCLAGITRVVVMRVCVFWCRGRFKSRQTNQGSRKLFKTGQ